MNVAAVAGKSVVVTGAGGSIGSEICRTIAPHVRKLTLVSLTEGALYNIEKDLRDRGTCAEIEGVLGSVGDAALMKATLHGADLVIHAAAHKHVPICERNPLAAIENNVLGTYNLARTAAGVGVKDFLLISTDKAVRPASIMGWTKRAAELIVKFWGEASSSNFVTVRFGNVMDSAGSVLPRWREQLARGGPITVTDPRCERYFMSIPDAVELILGVLSMPFHGEGTFVFDMGPPRRISDMLQEMIANYQQQTGNQQEVEIKVTGLRPGEKLTEELSHGGELEQTIVPKVFRVHSRERLDPTKFEALRFAVEEHWPGDAVMLLKELGTT